MPHVHIKHQPATLSARQQAELLASITQAIQRAFGCDEKVISISIESIEKDAWNERVYEPEIVNRKELLRKIPQY